MLIYEYKLAGTPQQYAAIDEAIRITQFIRNKCLRKWMDERGVSANDLQCYCAVLAKEYAFASLLNSQQWLQEQPQGCTGGHSATGTPRRVRNASGQKTTTASQQ